MYDPSLNDRYLAWAQWGRFALALVSRRAGTCRQRNCGRRRHCLARFLPTDNFHREAGNCPVMNGAEWRSVSLGMRGNWGLLWPWRTARQDAQDRENEAREKAEKLSREERIRRWRSEAEAERREAHERLSGPGHEYFRLLWMRGEGEHLYRPRDIVAAGEELIAFQAARGCHCAKAGRLDCEDEEECRARIEEAAIGSRQSASGEERIASSE